MCHKIIKSNEGMTLLEIIVAITILGIVIVATLTMFQLAYYQIYTGGERTDNILELEIVIDDLTTRNDIVKFESASEVSTYLASKGYYQCLSETALYTDNGSEINFYVSAETTNSGVIGYEVIVVKFLNEEGTNVELSTFVIKGGSK